MAAASVTFLGVFGLLFGTLLLGIVRLANHLAFAVTPNYSHSLFGVTNMTNFVREIGVRLTLPRQNFRSKKGIQKYRNKIVSACRYTRRR